MVAIIPGKNANKKLWFGQGVEEGQVVEDQTEVSPPQGGVV